MGNQLDSTGAFIFKIVESGLGLTKANQYPQWVTRLLAVRKYVTDPADITHFQAQGLLVDGQPGWVDWSGFNEDIVAYLVLFKDKDNYDASTALMNYDQLQAATGWAGTSFDALSDNSMIGKEILGRVELNTYNDKTSPQVQWIDSVTASPERQLKTLDIAEVKKLSAKLGAIKKNAPSKPAVAAAPKPAAVTKPGRGTPPTAATPSTAQPVAQPEASAAPVLSTPAPATPIAPKSSPPPKKTKAATPPPPPVNDAATGLLKETTQNDAWNYINAIKGDNDDATVQDAWLSSCAEACPGVDDDTKFKPSDWARVRDLVIKDLDLKA